MLLANWQPWDFFSWIGESGFYCWLTIVMTPEPPDHQNFDQSLQSEPIWPMVLPSLTLVGIDSSTKLIMMCNTRVQWPGSAKLVKKNLIQIVQMVELISNIWQNSVMHHVSPVTCHMSRMTTNQYKQPQQDTLRLLISPICTVGWFP